MIGYPLHLASSTKVSDKTVSTLFKAWWDNLAGAANHPSALQEMDQGYASDDQLYRAVSFRRDAIL